MVVIIGFIEYSRRYVVAALFQKMRRNRNIIHCVGVDKNSSVISFALHDYRRVFVEVFAIVIDQISERLPRISPLASDSGYRPLSQTRRRSTGWSSTFRSAFRR